MTRARLVAAALGFAPVAAFAPVFGRTATSALFDPAYLAPTAGAVAATAILTLLLARVAPAARTLTMLVLLLAPAAVLLRAHEGPKRLLTSALPLDPTGPELACVGVLCGLAALGAIEGALRRPGSVLPLAAPVAVTAIGTAIGEPSPWLAPAIVLAALVLLWRRWAAVTLVVLIVASTALAPMLLRDRSRYDPRTLVPQPVRPLVDTSPLAQFAAIQSGRLPLSVRVETDSSIARMRYVSLDTFDGDYWTSSTQYRRAGLRLPPGPGTVPSVPTVEHVTVERAGPLGWLVASGRPTDVTVAGLGVDEGSGEVVFPDDRPPPARYTVHSAVPVWDDETLAAALPAPAAQAKPIPPDLAQAAQRIVGSEYGHPALSRLAEHFASEGGYGVDEPKDARPGHGLLHIRQLLADRHGTSEQYASTFAVLARGLGYDTRVTVGFVPRRESGGYAIAGRDIDAWAEVRFDGIGWVPYFATPGQQAKPVERAPEPEATPTPQPTDWPDPAAPPGGSRLTIPEVPALRLMWALAAVGALAIVALFVPPLAKLMRRRGRRRGAPARQIIGAWRDTVERFVEAGLPAPASATATELACAAADRFTPDLREPATRLAHLHDAAVFGPSIADSAPAWRHADHIRATLRRSLRPHRRLAAALSPRPLFSRRAKARPPLLRVARGGAPGARRSRT